MGSCNHVFVWFYDKPFQVVKGLKWDMEYCKCGAKQARLFYPDTKPISVDQPTPKA